MLLKLPEQSLRLTTPFLLFLGFTPEQTEQPHQTIYLQKNLTMMKIIKLIIKSALKTIQIIIQRKYSAGREFPTLTVRSEAAAVHTFIASKNDDRIIMQPIRIASELPRKMKKWNQLKCSKCRTNHPTYSFSVAYSSYPSSRSTSPDMATVSHLRSYDTFIEIGRNLKEQFKCPVFLQAVLALELT